ncbi:DNA-binding protein [Salmonella enterica subsp. enterica serovar Panama]|uniref:DNA-binding protein n=1 Tax=Enterobacteriaceae TaxID=543 RepID=UPI0014745816|nr:DNA-binding protein [Salmonella enterica]EGC7113082.1 DNA-binding protein [Salmonella enterica]EGN5359712.1 DNA-binding protein [Salmonella enterica]EGO0260035.1 DNA-binding protein [Salmonella enterica subsp. enterica serovar Panama]EGP7451759.1 DNA-binding protein [Salmonella enterica subsp. enterica serovar Panama]NMF72039.1 DNA-binding protein [Salmonella enterica subsp. enterica serovar Panama]
MPNCIPLNPVLPKNFDDTPNEKRSKSQLDAWWDHPYGITRPDGKITVRCLNGGAWDRSTVLGVADSYEEACELAEREQSAWVKRRAEPIFYYSGEAPFRAVRDAQRPDQEQTFVASFDTQDELINWLNSQKTS